MIRLRQQALQRVGAFCVAIILLVPVAFSGHRHSDDQRSGSDSCAVCAATAHSPAVDSPAAPLLAPALRRLAAVECFVAAPPATYRPFKAGRAPPSSFSLAS
ncbi:MAG: hypothetical protein HY270_08435 [Deltaproteobacteria bacterium]|nr:hypothetical protein [Deltaproteobacteria bacterium]